MPKMRMTAKAVKAIKPPEKGRTDYQDEVVPGLVLRVAASGRKTWTASYWLKGKRPRVTLGITEDSPKRGPSVTDLERLSLREARDAAEGVFAKVKLGNDPAAKKREKRNAKTFAEIAGEYLQRHAKKKKTPKGAREDERRIEDVLLPLWGDWKAEDVDTSDVVDVLDEYVDRGHPYAANRMQSLISKIYAFAGRRGRIKVNPAKGIERQEEKPRKRHLTDDEVKIVLPLFRDAGLAGLGFELLLLTGQRPSEVFGMPWSEYSDGVWTIPKARSKHRSSTYAPESHEVPLSPQARAVMARLKEYDNGNWFVFPSRIHGKPMTSYQAAARRVKDAAGLSPGWRIYDLKDTCLTGIEDLGFAPHVASAVANHQIGDVTDRHYASGRYPSEKAKALAAWGAHVEELAPTMKEKVVPIRRRA